MTLAGFRNSVVSSTTGLPVSGATVTVVLAGTSTPASIYRDKLAATPIIDLVTDAAGFFEFYAAAGTYDVTVSLGASSVVWNDVAVGTMQSTDYNRVWRVDSGEAEDLDSAISGLTPVVKTAAEWEADTETVLSVGRFGYASDTNVLKVGNGGDLFGDRQAVGGSGDGHDAVTLSSTLSATIATPGRELVASDATFGLSGQEIWHDRFRFVDASGGTVDLPLADSLTVGTQIDLQVTDATNAITIERPTVAEEGTGTTNGTDTVTMADTSVVRVGDVVSGTSVTSSQTVLSITPDTSIVLSAAADGSQADDTLTFTGQRGVFNGSEADVTLRKGLVVIKVTSNTTGIDAEILGATTEGFGPILVRPETGNFDISSAHFGKSADMNATSSTQTATFPTPAAVGALYSGNEATTGVIYAADLGATSFALATDGSTLKLPDGATAYIVPGSEVRYRAISSTAWSVVGGLVPS